MPISSNTHREVKAIKDDHGHDHGDDDDHASGSFARLMRRVYSLEDLLKKLRWERSAVQTGAEEEMLQGGEVCEFRMPLHYPKYSKADYESMAEWKLDILLRQYGLDVTGDVEYKREVAVGAFLWPDQRL
ncbi:hypothetical protein SUGI_0319100 [Cryptomeria japonica]|uniref:uncharacterized protein LOC131066660 n=1 Tax=Cryptomeria japonica TaxID=3369 RepID=UPI0024089B15|nr:uncharacterized protein LOC131066660 [Cryptomeria japonica]GLJ18077.1 hypothetical protein SUGI_0319100 [Cryptomeria japonica]